MAAGRKKATDIHTEYGGVGDAQLESLIKLHEQAMTYLGEEGTLVETAIGTLLTSLSGMQTHLLIGALASIEQTLQDTNSILFEISSRLGVKLPPKNETVH